MITRKYSWKPDLPDQRDYKFGKLTALKSFNIELPPSISLKEWCSPVEDQGSLGSCTANALVSALEFNQEVINDTYKDLSRLFVYYNERVIEGTVKEDSGAMIRDGIKTLASQGVCKESSWPYNLKKWKNKPTKFCYKSALQYKISSYYRVDNTNIIDLKMALANKHPFVFGFAVYESFETYEVAKTGNASMPSPTEKMLGGHAVLGVGYDDTTRRFLIKNSWGTDWGQGGYFTLPYEYLTNNNLADDFWVVVK